jgi:hypothetical protein
MRNIQKMAAIAIIATGSLAMAGFASAATPQLDKEVAAAATHAGLAAESEDIAGVRTHLHHTVNCLVGPKGDDFAPKEMNPCSALGNGAIPDSSDKGTTIALRAALDSANSGIAEDDLAKAKADATAVKSMLLAIKL